MTCPDCGHLQSEHYPPPSQDASGGCTAPSCPCDRWFDETRQRVRVEGDADADGHVLVGLTCWCRPYRDREDPEVVIHRPAARA